MRCRGKFSEQLGEDLVEKEERTKEVNERVREEEGKERRKGKEMGRKKRTRR